MEKNYENPIITEPIPYPNFQELIETTPCNLYIEECRYGSGFMAGIDFPYMPQYDPPKEPYKGDNVQECIDIANSPGDVDAMNAASKLSSYAQMHPEFLFARKKDFGALLEELDSRAALWNSLDVSAQEKMLLEFVSFSDDCI